LDPLQGKRVLAVGGTAGLGLALALSLAERSASVSVVGRTDPKRASLAFIKV
jgi:NAD(P)-dependent dehydrogenase (short-subunit alcohol dehydrogenase family)